MPFSRPTLTDLRSQVAQDVASALPGSDALLRHSNLNIMSAAQAGLASLHYGYLDWIAKQAVPFTATDEFLEGWAALKGVIRIAATSAIGAVTFNGAAGATIPVGTKLVRGDGVTFTVQALATIGVGGTATVSATADPDPSGMRGAFGNTALNAVMTLGSAIAGVQSNGLVTTLFAGGADIETNDALRTRMLFAYQTPPRGGAKTDYETWAKEVPGVTRAWAVSNLFGAGSVVVYIMLDTAEGPYGGFPQGVSGAATGESRGTPATGDQLLVANHIFSLQPVTAFVNIAAPVAHPINFTIQNLPVLAQASASAAIADVFLRDGAPGAAIPLNDIWSAISSISGAKNFVILSPAGADIANPAGALPTVGVITYTSTP